MMLKIGINKRAFTLIEVMLAAMVLALGAVLIHEAFFTCVDTFNYCYDYFSVAGWLNEKIWQIQQDFKQLGPTANPISQGEFRYRNKDFLWDLTYSLAFGASDLYEINAAVSWKEGPRNIRISRTAFAKYVEKK
jgi:prepilin-type N-terminal cleavage/methylation domain-containing protein